MKYRLRILSDIAFLFRWMAWAWRDAREGVNDCHLGYDLATRRKLMKRRAEKEPKR